MSGCTYCCDQPKWGLQRPSASRRPRHLTVVAVMQTKKRIVFLGTPEVAAESLQTLYTHTKSGESLFQICAVVSQPGKPRGRGNKNMPVPTPVEQAARDLGFGEDTILCPTSAKEESFLSTLRDLQPDLCITAAYGNMLPQSFLDIPQLGTLNIHPSLLPKFRGAAPVQRAVQAGVDETGVSVAYTVLRCDAGPVLAQEKIAMDPDIMAPELLSQLFRLGTQLLIRNLPAVYEGRGLELATPQDEAAMVHAAKLTKEESNLDFTSCSATALHNKVRAFAGWPGTTAYITLEEESTGKREVQKIKICSTRIVERSCSENHVEVPPSNEAEEGSSINNNIGSLSSTTTSSGSVLLTWGPSDTLLIPCLGGTVLEVLLVQPPTKKVMTTKDFKNGIRGKRLYITA
ncbi:hypothetical protein CEUSTIGMA_g3380.t1 [Chlamydomonas eustigma]|uniref:Methionyl-tRNA formyltransferase, mitochondrial n=1 Tax=Chlamydomonas eustigma TaxID=1157962 RepID=A0A250WYL5_9CHLO|nr:hypothetical protein CEUSTIGMA_g3380.t1 [Chlamydomonas eustigma]|eukprot:GAX75937.1 hypothetical protein CEUSTIGMA_g3380.t1 [Chlamydomonas eustigma]